MKKVFFLPFFLLYLSCAFSQEITFAIGEWQPYTTHDETGLATEIVIAACNAVGLKPTLIHVPWLRAENYVEKGEIVATFPYTLIESRKNKYFFSDPIFNSTSSIIYNSANKKINLTNITNIEYFKDYKIGITTGSDELIIPLRNLNIEVETTETIDLSMKKLQFLRIDFIIEDTYVIKELLRSFNDNSIIELKNISYLFPNKDFRIMFTKNNKNSQKYLEQLNRGLKIIRSNGEHQKIIQKYLE